MQRPWNKTPLPVYSLVTSSQENIYNMNICTYVVPISMHPKRYMIALDPTTKTYENFSKNTKALLQILSKDCRKYVKILGKSSGHNSDKCTKLKKSLSYIGGVPVLRESVASLEVEKIQEILQDTWDHHIFIVEVKRYVYLNSNLSILTTDDLYTS
jgi:flavin reductase (DIM6/NTAB) family NADH-FMN oxidoreductase RutF